MQRKVYILENLDCANCAAKIERKLSKLPELSDVSVTFATKQLRFAAEDPEAVLPKIRETIQSMEPDVEVVERTRSRRKAEGTHNHEHHHHEHGEECGCGHDHHDHDHDHGGTRASSPSSRSRSGKTTGNSFTHTFSGRPSSGRRTSGRLSV